MPFRFEMLTDRPVLINSADLRANSDEIPAMEDEARTWLDRLENRVYYIVNLGNARLSLGDLMESASHAARGTMASMHHPKVIESLVVSTDPMVAMAARSVNSYVFGNLHLKVFGTIDEALAYVDRQADMVEE